MKQCSIVRGACCGTSMPLRLRSHDKPGSESLAVRQIHTPYVLIRGMPQTVSIILDYKLLSTGEWPAQSLLLQWGCSDLRKTHFKWYD